MELKQLNYFVAVAQEGTISGAARRLNLTQPPLSAQMKLLEQEIGCPLFERGARKIQLTEAGRMLYNRAVTMLEFADITRQELKDYLEGTNGVLRMGVVSSVAGTCLAGIVSGFHQENPQISFELMEANTYQLLEQLQANLLELAIVRTPFSDQGFTSFCILDEPMLAVGNRRYFDRCTLSGALQPPDHGSGANPAFSNRTDKAPGYPLLPFPALAGKPLIIYRRWEEVLFKHFQSAHINPFIFCKNDDARTSALWADAGLGVAILPASAAGLIRNPQTLICQIDDRRLTSGICVVTNKDAWLSAVARTFLSYLKQLPRVSGQMQQPSETPANS